MARKRMIDPGFWTDPHIGKLSRDERLLFIGCISAADDDGRLLGSAAFLRSQVFPYDEDLTVEDVRAMRNHLLEIEKNLILYEVDEVKYLAFRKWSRYQKPSHPTPSRLPPPYGLNNSGETRETPPNASRNVPPQDSIGKDSIGKDSIEQDSTTKIFSLYEQNIGQPTPIMIEELRKAERAYPFEWIEEAFQIAVERNARNWRYIKAILERWRREGKDDGKKKRKKHGGPPLDASYEEVVKYYGGEAEDDGM